jgi:hypothetical protein
LVVSGYSDTNINILTNAGFEVGTTGWSNGNCSISAESGTVHIGSGSAKAYSRTSTWQGISQDILSSAVSDETYQVSGWVTTVITMVPMIGTK